MSHHEDSEILMQPMLKARRQRDAVIGALLVFLALLGGLMIYFMAIRPAQRWEQVRNWPSAPCVIVHSEFEVVQNNDSDDSYGALILYDYVVNGQRYTGDKFSSEGNTHGSNRDFYQARVARYPVGSEATCHVNPRDASEAVLEKIEPETWFGWLGLLVIPMSVFVVWSHLVNERRLAQLSASG